MENTAARIQRNTQCFFYLFLFDMKADGVLSKEDTPLSVQLLGLGMYILLKLNGQTCCEHTLEKQIGYTRFTGILN